MNKIKDYFFSFVANRMSTERLLSRFTQPLVVHPFYHAVTDNYLPHLNPLYKPKTFQKFKNDLDFLGKYFQEVSAEDVLLYTQGEKTLQANAFHLSFDDGLREVYTVVLPYLYRKGIPATIFINNDFVNNETLFYRHKAALIVDVLTKKEISPALAKEMEGRLAVPMKKTLTAKILAVQYSQREILDEIASLLDIDFEQYLRKHRPYLSMKEIREMQKKGFTVGAHSVDHPPFAGLTEEEQIRQILESVAFVKRVAQEQHRYFSFPFTDESVPDTVFQAIYRQSKRNVELSFGITGIGTRHAGRHIARIDMEKYGRDAKEAINKALLKSSFRTK